LNRVKDILKEGRVAIGTGGGIDPSVIQYLANVGFDYLTF
jgi:PP-loop superfamily ATP-utilizing enzyme